MTPREIKEKVLQALEAIKAMDIKVLYVADQTTVADYFILATGRSGAHVRAIAERLEEDMENAEIFATRKEGISEGRWVVVDYGSVIVHIFNSETRDIYDLEKLWSKAGEKLEEDVQE